MKKSIALVALAFGVTSAFAQDLTSKKGEPILPEAGDYMIGIDANPFLNYAGNFFGKTAANVAPSWNFLNGNNMIIGKYFKDANTAYRVGIRLGINNQTTKAEIADLSSTAPTFPTLPTMKEDVYKNSNKAIGITVGLEKRKGKTRLQGFYGADFMLWGSSQKEKYTYGNTIDVNSTTGLAVVSAANTTNFGSNLTTIAGSGATSGRVTEKKTGNGLGIGLRAFIGAEYFILPKISIGGEFGWGIGFMTGGKTSTTVQSSQAGAPNLLGDITKEVKNGASLALDTDLNNSTTGSILAPSASLRLNLHF